MSAAQSRVVADRYRLVELLGQGGMGRVWMARDELLHRDVAIKELIPPPGLTDDERQEMRERAMREARAIARLSHPNVVRIFDILRSEGEPWIVMEYVASRSLQAALAQDGPLPARRVAEIGLGMLSALRAAHRAGVVHRDVKPGNVLLGDDGRVVLTDFGLATVPGDPVVTRTGLVLGSPAYISPERAHDGTAGPAADMWSLGATLYAAVEGQSPYARPSAIATLAALATEPPAPPRRAGALKPVLNGLLRKNPAERIQAAEADRLLMRAAGRRSRVGMPLLPGARRPFAEGYLPVPHPSPGSAPVIAGVAAVPPPRRSTAQPEKASPPAEKDPDKPVADVPDTPADKPERSESVGVEGSEVPETPGAVAAGDTPAASGTGDTDDSSDDPATPGGATTPADASPTTAPEPARSGAPSTIAADGVGSEPAPGTTTPEARPAPAARTEATDGAGAASGTTPARRAVPVPRSTPAPRAVPPVLPAMAETKVTPAVREKPDPVREALDRIRAVPKRVRGASAAAVALIVAVVLLVVVLSDGDKDPKAGPQGGAQPSASAAGRSSASAPATSSSTPTAQPTPTASQVAPPTGDNVELPAGWHIYRDSSGFSVAVPKSWRIDRQGTIVYFREDVGQRRVLGIDRSDYPKSDPVKDWKNQEAQRSYTKPNYHRVRIEKVDYFVAAADWEYTYDGNAKLHAINRGFVTGPHQAHAILWITPERTWEANLDNFDRITRSFTPINP